MPIDEIVHNNLNNYARELRASDVSFSAVGFPERYVPRVDAMRILLALALAPICLPIFAQEMQIFDVYPTIEKLEVSWDFFMEVEQKSAGDLYKTSSCLSSEEFMNEFPISDRTGLYWDYVNSQ